MKPPLMDHQVVAIDYLRKRKRAGLFLAMGAGKTRSVLEAIGPEHLPVLVIAPKRVAETVWPHERDLWRPDLSLALAAGNATERREALTAGADVTVIGRDNIGDISKVNLDPYTTVVIDELSGFKNRSTKRWKLAATICNPAEYVWGLTGTPAPNGLLDLWAQIYLLDRGHRLGKNITGYKNRYFNPGRQLPTGVIIDWYLKPFAEENIHKAIEDLCLGMKGDDRVTYLQPKEPNYVPVKLPANVANAYKKFAKDLVIDLDVLGGEVHSAANAAVLTAKLSQMTAGFMYVDDADIRNGEWDVLHNEKVETLVDIIEAHDSPVLVFYRFKAEAAMIKARIPKAVTRINAETIAAWNRGEIPVLLAHPASAGHGLNLQYGGHCIVWTTQTWSLEEWQQANARLIRTGQTEVVEVHVLQVPGSVDKLVADAINDKAITQGALLDHLESPL